MANVEKEIPERAESFFSELIKKAAEKVESKKQKDNFHRAKKGKRNKTDPKQGHHIINKDVKNIYKEIIEEVVSGNKDSYLFKGMSYEKLKEMKMIVNDKNDSVLDLLHLTDALLPQSESFIDGTPVFNLSKNGKADENAENYGLAKFTLILCVDKLMHEIYDSLQLELQMPKNLTDWLNELSSIIRRFFYNQSSEYAYVDYEALRVWRKEKGQYKESNYEECVDDVWKMLENIGKTREKQVGNKFVEKKPLVVYWGMWAFLVNQAPAKKLPSLR